MIDLKTLHIIEIEIIPMLGLETFQIIENLNIKMKDHEIFLTTDQTIKDQNRKTIKNRSRDT